MKDTFSAARLVANDLIRLVIFSSVPYERIEATLFEDRKSKIKLVPTRLNTTSNLWIADFHLSEDLELGHSYALLVPSFGLIPLDVTEATSFPDFDKKYSYDGTDLGVIYDPKATSFALWAPLASTVLLKITKKGANVPEHFLMRRSEKGVYRLTLKGDYEGAAYTYFVTNSEATTETTDPYAKGSMPNGAASVVVDLTKCRCDFHKEALPVLTSACDAIVYEGSVRDLSVDPHSDIAHKGTFLGLSEAGCKTDTGLPAGLDYIASLGITHFQVLPMYDFKTVDELDPAKGYNWGYDPAQYFVPEGSYASAVSDPYSRIQECQAMVAAFHEKGIRIVMDVVFNHVYDYLTSAFEKTVPNYYFRRKDNGRMANCSYCGDDLASERPMVHKLIVEAAKWWIDVYGVDGFRFDLMGLLDAKTLEEIASYGRSKDPSFIVYGEGWSMGAYAGGLPLGTMENHKVLADFGFFNDRYREPLKKWLAGDEGARDDFKHAFVGSCLDYYGKPLFLNASQSVNYVECHDNATFYDFISSARGDLSVQERLAICKLAYSLVLLSYGIPFIHAGEEIGESKFGKDNTYNLPDVYNKFSYRLLGERKAMYDYFRGLVKFRKEHRFLHVYDPRVIDPLLSIADEGALLVAAITDGDLIAPYREITLLINPSDGPLTHEFPSDREVLLDSSGLVEDAHIKVTSALVPPHSLFLVGLPIQSAKSGK
jgi:pullulanase